MLECFWRALAPGREKGRTLGGPPGGSWATFGVSFLVLRCLVRRSAASRALLEAILSVQHPSQAISRNFVMIFSRFPVIFTDFWTLGTSKIMVFAWEVLHFLENHVFASRSRSGTDFLDFGSDFR